MPVITLTTDFGLTDAFVGTMKGVILSICPTAQIVDITHDVPPQDIVAGALLLADACRYFPAGTIHLAVVDPGVGTSRAAIAIKTERYFFVGPDNGLFDLSLRHQKPVRTVQINNSAYHLKPVSATFHGRDVFAPAAAHLAAGVDIEKLGEAMPSLTKLSLPSPQVRGEALEIHVLRTDRFGNAITDLRIEEFQTWNPTNAAVIVNVGGNEIFGTRRTFSDVSKGQPVAYFGSGGRLEIAINAGNAAESLHLLPGSIINLKRA
jgi:S-adenosylmethionine hydrolase